MSMTHFTLYSQADASNRTLSWLLRDLITIVVLAFSRVHAQQYNILHNNEYLRAFYAVVRPFATYKITGLNV